MDPLFGMMKRLGNPQLTPELKQTIIDGVLREAGGSSVDQLAQDRERCLVGLLKLRSLNPKTVACSPQVGPAYVSDARPRLERRSENYYRRPT